MNKIAWLAIVLKRLFSDCGSAIASVLSITLVASAAAGIATLIKNIFKN
jgi:hypothetical protein